MSTIPYRHPRGGFTLIEMIIYVTLVSGILTTMSYLILNLIDGQINIVSETEVNYNVRFIRQLLERDVHAAQSLSVVGSDELTLQTPGGILTYRFDATEQKLTRQLDANPPVDVSSDEVLLSGSFSDVGFPGRTATVQADVQIDYRNPGQRSAYDATRFAQFILEAAGRR